MAGDGGTVIWPLLVGVNKAKECLMLGRLLKGREAERIGLVNHSEWVALRANPEADMGRYALGAVVLALGLMGLHRWLPNHQRPLRALLPGVLLTLALWLVGASLFSLYLGTIADYSVTYGSLAGVAITLLFFYLTGALFILGAEYNAVRLENAPPPP